MGNYLLQNVRIQLPNGTKTEANIKNLHGLMAYATEKNKKVEIKHDKNGHEVLYVYKRDKGAKGFVKSISHKIRPPMTLLLARSVKNILVDFVQSNISGMDEENETCVNGILGHIAGYNGQRGIALDRELEVVRKDIDFIQYRTISNRLMNEEWDRKTCANLEARCDEIFKEVILNKDSSIIDIENLFPNLKEELEINEEKLELRKMHEYKTKWAEIIVKKEYFYASLAQKLEKRIEVRFAEEMKPYIEAATAKLNKGLYPNESEVNKKAKELREAAKLVEDEVSIKDDIRLIPDYEEKKHSNRKLIYSKPGNPNIFPDNLELIPISAPKKTTTENLSYVIERVNSLKDIDFVALNLPSINYKKFHDEEVNEFIEYVNGKKVTLNAKIFALKWEEISNQSSLKDYVGENAINEINEMVNSLLEAEKDSISQLREIRNKLGLEIEKYQQMEFKRNYLRTPLSDKKNLGAWKDNVIESMGPLYKGIQDFYETEVKNKENLIPMRESGVPYTDEALVNHNWGPFAEVAKKMLATVTFPGENIQVVLQRISQETKDLLILALKQTWEAPKFESMNNEDKKKVLRDAFYAGFTFYGLISGSLSTRISLGIVDLKNELRKQLNEQGITDNKIIAKEIEAKMPVFLQIIQTNQNDTDLKNELYQYFERAFKEPKAFKEGVDEAKKESKIHRLASRVSDGENIRANVLFHALFQELRQSCPAELRELFREEETQLIELIKKDEILEAKEAREKIKEDLDSEDFLFLLKQTKEFSYGEIREFKDYVHTEVATDKAIYFAIKCQRLTWGSDKFAGIGKVADAMLKANGELAKKVKEEKKQQLMALAKLGKTQELPSWEIAAFKDYVRKGVITEDAISFAINFEPYKDDPEFAGIGEATSYLLKKERELAKKVPTEKHKSVGADSTTRLSFFEREKSQPNSFRDGRKKIKRRVQSMGTNK